MAKVLPEDALADETDHDHSDLDRFELELKGTPSVQRVPRTALAGLHLPPFSAGRIPSIRDLTAGPSAWFEQKPAGVAATLDTTFDSVMGYPLKGLAIKPKMFVSSGGVHRVLKSPNLVHSALTDTYNKDVVEFDSVEYCCAETDRGVVVNVVRRGPSRSTLKMTYGVVDKKHEFAKDGTRIYIKTGTAVLESGSKLTPINIEVTVDDSFTVERLFDVSLNFAGGARDDATLGDLAVCRVVVLNDDKFPANLYDKEDKDKQFLRLDETRPVIMAFIRLNYALLKKEAKRGLLFKLVPGISFVINQSITQYIVKTITIGFRVQGHNDGVLPDFYQDNLELLAWCYFANFLFVCMVDMLFANLKLGGKAKSSLRVFCMYTCSQLTPAGEEKFDTGRIMKILDHAVETAVDSTWMTCFTVYASIVKLLFMFMFMFYTIYVQATLNNAPQLMWLMTVPFVLIFLDTILFLVSFGEGAKSNFEAMELDDEWGSYVAQTSFLRQVITTFRQGFAVTENFSKILQAYNSKAFAAAIYTKRTQYASNIIPTIISCLIMVSLGWRAMIGQITVGAFIVFINTINAVGPTIGDIFMEFFNIGKGYASIIHIAGLLNSDTRRRMLHAQSKVRKDMIEDMKAALEISSAPSWDPDQLVIENMTYQFKHQIGTFVTPISCRMEGCQVIALKGGGSVGKKIILRLIARHLVPTTGFVYYPSRWRIRFMDATPLFFGGDMSKLARAKLLSPDAYAQARRESTGTLEYNLKFGAQFEHPNHAVWDREIFALLQKLRVSADLIGATAEEFCVERKFTLIGLNGEKLSQTDRALLTLARSLLSSVDLLLVSNVLDTLGPELGVHIMTVLKELTVHRSLAVLATEHSTTPAYLKKMKTVIFSTKLGQLEALADNWMLIGEPMEVKTSLG